MSNANVSSKPGSGTTWPSGRKALHATSEADYLAQQAATAKAAITTTARAMGAGLHRAADEHPLLAIGLAAITGALVARIIAPSAHHGHDGESAKPPAPSFIEGFLAETIQPLVLDLAAAAARLIITPTQDPKPPRS